MIKKLLLLANVVLTASISLSQTITVYEEDFETGGTWINSFTTGPNTWIHNNCAGNGPSLPGTNATYIYPGGGTTDDCNPATGKFRYGYENSVGLQGGAISCIDIDATCTSSLQFSFDYQGQGTPGEETLEVVYSTDGGTTFLPIGAPLASVGTWSSQSIALPALLNGISFKLGFRFIYDNANVFGIAPAFDNIVVTGADVTPPVINVCVPNINYSLNINCEVTVMDEKDAVVATDNCTSQLDLILTQSPAPGVVTFTAPGQTQVFTITVEDEAGNTTQCTFTGTAIDNNNPTVTCPTLADAFVNTACQLAVPDISSLVIWTDNCTSTPASMTFLQNPLPGTLVDTTLSILYTVTDPFGNSTQCSSTLNVVDAIDPILVCPPNATISKNAACEVVVLDYAAAIGITENCFYAIAPSISQLPLAGATITVPTIITMTVIDESANSAQCTFTVTPIDDSNPIITCPLDSTIASTNCQFVMDDFSDEIIATDNCSALFNMVVTQTPAIGTSLTGTNVVQFTVEDESGNSASCSFNLTVADLTDPTIGCPSNFNIDVDASCAATLADYTTSLQVLLDDCTSNLNLVLTQNPASGAIINGNTEIFITAEDEAGNQATCSFFAITIDPIAPSLTCPDTLTSAINSSCQYTMPDVSVSVTASDNCSSIGNLTFTQNPIAGSIQNGLTATIITVQDQQGNQATCLTIIAPIDTEAPTITCPANPYINNGTNCDYTLPNYGATTLVLDNCQDFTLVQYPPIGTVVTTGPTQIEMMVIDAGGNTASCSFTLTVDENIDPTITCPTNISQCNPIVSYAAPIVVENCSFNLMQIDGTGLTSGDLFPVGTTIQQYEVTDLAGNSASCFFTVQILDYPGVANIADDTIGLCDITSTTITADAHTTGAGEWTVLTGNGNFNNQFTNSTAVNNLDYGTNILVYQITSASCGSDSDTLVIEVSQLPLPASTQDTVLACFDTEISLLANTPLYGSGLWTTNDPTAIIDDADSSNTFANNLSEGWHNYIWTITNGSCPATSDTVHILVAKTAIIDQADTSLCVEVSALVLSGSTPAAGQTASWSVISGTGVLSETDSTVTSISGFEIGVNTVVYLLEHPICSVSSDTISIVSYLCEGFNPVFPTVITPNLDGKNDIFEVDFLEVAYPNCHVVIFNRWGSVVFESTGYAVPFEGKYNGEDLPMGTYFYKIELNDSNQTVYNGPISIIH
ncbi:MAG: HYR domain-containing protein [Bacteroidota bacterium]